MKTGLFLCLICVICKGAFLWDHPSPLQSARTHGRTKKKKRNKQEIPTGLFTCNRPALLQSWSLSSFQLNGSKWLMLVGHPGSVFITGRYRVCVMPWGWLQHLLLSSQRHEARRGTREHRRLRICRPNWYVKSCYLHSSEQPHGLFLLAAILLRFKNVPVVTARLHVLTASVPKENLPVNQISSRFQLKWQLMPAATRSHYRGSW